MNSLSLPTDYTALDRAKLADGTRRHYKAAIALLIASNIDPTDHTQLTNYANTLPASGKANLKAALSIMTRDYINKAKTSNAPIETIQRFLWLMETINDVIEIHDPTTQRTPHWLSQSQVDTITSAALANSRRDYIVLAVLLGAGLRREELETLTFDALSQIPHRGAMKDVLTVIGKGDKKRVIPIPALLASHLREWKAATGGGRIARKVSKSGKIGDSLSAVGIFTIVRKYGALISIDDLDPHDLRRSYGRIMYEATKDIVLVKNLLGHSSVRTTQKYIGLHINLDIAEDVFPIREMKVSGD
jgi:site-specific recombinase XerC